jgi:transcriptional regulator with XRE-family HTH domain
VAEINNNDLAMDGHDRRRQLGGFLRECRERIGPEAVGLPGGGRRRTPGLRREEVASLAGISTTYYTKIEQGSVVVSERALSNIAEVLKLNNTERNYAFALATGRTPVQLEERVSPTLMRLLELYEPYPAQILGRRWDFLAWNQAACSVFMDLDQIPPQARNLIMIISMDPAIKHTLVDWEKQVRRIMAEFRADYGKYHSDPAFGALIASLLDSSPLFDEWWNEYKDVGSPSDVEMGINHPTAGRLNLLEIGLIANDHPGLRVILFLPQDEETKEKLIQLYEERVKNK